MVALSTHMDPANIFLDDVTDICTSSFYKLLAESLSNHLHGLVQEIENIIKEWVQRNNEIAASERPTQNNDQDRAFLANCNRITQHLRAREAERNEFTRIFPDWKNKRKATIELLNEIADDLEADHSLTNATNSLADLSYLVSSSMSLLRNLHPTARLITNVLSSSYGILKIGIISAEKYRIKTHMGRAERLVDSDRTEFMLLSRWFTYNDELMSIMNEAINEDVVKSCFTMFQNFYLRVTNNPDNHSVVQALQIALDGILEYLISYGFSLHYAVPFAAALFKIFLVSTVGFLSLESRITGKYLSYLKSTAVCGFAACTTLKAVNDFWNSPSEVGVPAGAYVGVAIFIAIAFLSGSFKKDSKSEQAMKVRKVVILLNTEMENIESVYTQLSRDM